MRKVFLYTLFYLFFSGELSACGGCGCNLGYGGNLSALSYQAPSLISAGYSFARVYRRGLLDQGRYSLHSFNMAGQYTFKDNFQVSLVLPYNYAAYTSDILYKLPRKLSGIGDPIIGIQYLNTEPLADDVSLFYAVKTATSLPLGKYDPDDDPILQPGGGNWQFTFGGQAELGYKKMSLRIAGDFNKYLYNPQIETRTGNVFNGDLWITRKFAKKDFMIYLFLGANYLKTATSYYKGYPITGSAFSLWNASGGFISMYKKTGIFFQWLEPLKQSNLYVNSVFSSNVSLRVFKLL